MGQLYEYHVNVNLVFLFQNDWEFCTLSAQAPLLTNYFYLLLHSFLLLLFFCVLISNTHATMCYFRFIHKKPTQQLWANTTQATICRTNEAKYRKLESITSSNRFRLNSSNHTLKKSTQFNSIQLEAFKCRQPIANVSCI